MIIIKKLLSYFYPVTVSKIKSDHTPGLETRLENGKLVLNAAHANYSYGALHRVMLQSLLKVNITADKNCLLLGMGGGSAIKIIQSLSNQTKIDAVEIDNAIISVAEKEFNVHQNKNLKIINADAFNYVETCPANYDLIIIDLFIDDAVPAKVFSMQFLYCCKSLLNPNGKAILNAAIPHKVFIQEKENVLKEVFTEVSQELIEGNVVYFLS
jgi:spermidine synthase